MCVCVHTVCVYYSSSSYHGTYMYQVLYIHITSHHNFYYFYFLRYSYSPFLHHDWFLLLETGHILGHDDVWLVLDERHWSRPIAQSLPTLSLGVFRPKSTCPGVHWSGLSHTSMPCLFLWVEHIRVCPLPCLSMHIAMLRPPHHCCTD